MTEAQITTIIGVASAGEHELERAGIGRRWTWMRIENQARFTIKLPLSNTSDGPSRWAPVDLSPFCRGARPGASLVCP